MTDVEKDSRITDLERQLGEMRNDVNQCTYALVQIAQATGMPGDQKMLALVETPDGMKAAIVVHANKVMQEYRRLGGK